MLRLDSISLECDLDLIKDIDSRKFNTLTKLDPDGNEIHSRGEVATETLRPYAGISKIVLTDRRLYVDISAKILQRDYHKLLTADTFPQAIEAISSTGIVTFDPADIMDKALITKCDVTNDLHVDKPIKEYMKSLRLFGEMNPKFHVRPYKSGGIVFTQQILKSAQRTILYDKGLEIGGDRYRDVLDVDRFDGVIRIESNLRTHKMKRELFGTHSRTIGEILQTDTGVNLRLLNKVIDADEIAESKKKYNALFNPDLTLHQIRQRKGDEAIIIACEYDVERIKRFVESYVKGNVSSYVRKFRDVMRAMDRTDEQGATIDESYIRELTDLLKVA